MSTVKLVILTVKIRSAINLVMSRVKAVTLWNLLHKREPKAKELQKKYFYRIK